MLDRLIKISSISGAFLIFCGVLKLIIYYSAFNIKIIDFLSLSEIVTSFLDDINILLIFAIIMVVISYMTLDFFHKKADIPFEDFFEGILKIIFPHKYKYVIFFSIVITTLFILLNLNIISFNYFVIYSLVFCTLQTLTYIVMGKDENGEIDIPDFSMGICITLTIVFAIYLLAQHDIQNIKSHDHRVVVYTQNGTYECHKETNTLYLGKTDSYLFIKMGANNSTLTIPMSEINRIEFK